MKKRLLLLLFFGLVLIQGQNKIVYSSEIKWKAYKVLKSNSLSHFGTLALKAGNIVLNTQNEMVSGNFIMDMDSLLADDMKGQDKMKLMLEKHLKSDDFFDVNNFPTVFFKITSVKKSNDRNFNSLVKGNLTIKNITKPIKFYANISQNGEVVNFVSNTFTFNRKDFGLQYNVFEDMVISNDVEMKVSFSAK